MTIREILGSKSVKPKEKMTILSSLLLEKRITLNELIEVARASKDSPKATCIEAIELATKADASIATKECLEFVSGALAEKAPRVKWESAKVIGNIAHLFPSRVDEALKNLLVNTEHEGTVVRWSAAYAIGEIVKLKTKRNKELVPAVEAICAREEKSSIRKIYAEALKKVQ